MKAAIVERYGGPEVVTIQEVPTPVPKSNEIRLRVHATTVNSGDARLRRADPWFVRLVFGFFGPRKKILGVAYAGVVDAVGKDITTVKIGDRIYGMSENFMGAHAEFLIIKEKDTFGPVPEHMNMQEAAALPFGATTALSFLDKMVLQNKTMLLIGASGAVGSTVLQIARDRGAIVTTLASAENESLLKALGADTCLDYRKIDVLKEEKTYDIVFDCVNGIPVNQIEHLVNAGGDIVLLAALIKETLQSRSIKKANVHVGTAKVTKEQFIVINTLFTQHKLRPVISKVFSLEEIRKAHAIVDSGRKVGNIVITVAHTI